MQLLCLGDIALLGDQISGINWPSYRDLSLDMDSKVLFNWELPIGEIIDSNPRECGGPRLLTDPKAAEIINQWKSGFACLATNHILDAGEEGLTTTLSFLQNNGFETIGAGLSSEEIEKPLIWETQEGKLGIINWVFPETHPDWMSIPGPNCFPGIEKAGIIIQKLKSNVDWLLVVAHWSDELFAFPTPVDRMVAKELANFGVDLFVCHHPHVVRGNEKIGNCSVFYSIGNFFFSDFIDENGKESKWAPKSREGLGIQVTLNRGFPPAYRVLSFWQDKSNVSIDSSERSSKSMTRLSSPLHKFTGEKYVEWYTKRRFLFDILEAKWYFGICRLGFHGTIRRAWALIQDFLKRSIRHSILR